MPLSARGKDSSPSSSVRGNTPRAMEPDVMPKSPVGLRCVSYTDTAVDLQWLPIIGLVELNWRNKALSKDAWRNANKLISGTKCRKKNLLAGATYEFRVRTVVEKAGGMLGLRSPWSTLIEVALKPSPGKEETSSSSAYSYSGSEKIKKEVFIRPPVRAASVSQMPTSTPRSEASEPSTPRAETPRAEPDLKAEKTTSVPVNLRPGPILTGLKER